MGVNFNAVIRPEAKACQVQHISILTHEPLPPASTPPIGSIWKPDG